ncbi:hypothetical protein ACIPPS_15325 [Streptomyces sp. NPDC090127]|uniref:hypothetical protein n=1 Tax=Streptomyces sp. NPDC090127 TaxID=3365953 RepID=UPI003818B0A1
MGMGMGMGMGMDTAEPQVCDDMTVEVALSVMSSARTGQLLVCDADGVCTHRVTQAQLVAVRDSDAYSDRVRLRDVLDGHGPFASARTTTGQADHATRHRRLAVVHVVDAHHSPLGSLAPAC